MRITIETGNKQSHKTTYQGNVTGRDGEGTATDLGRRLQVLAGVAGTLLITFLKAKYLLRAKKKKD